MNDPCPCDSGLAYSMCCKLVHNDIYKATTAEALMRSRYSAFVKANISYLLQSWSSKTRDNSKRFSKELLSWTTSVQWVKLQVEKSTFGSLNDTTGTVLFKAIYFEVGVLECIAENSYFEKENGHWVYVKPIDG